MKPILKLTKTVIKAAELYLSRKLRISHPQGSFDNAKRFTPEGEDAKHLAPGLRAPSRAYPYSYMVSCRTAAHVARMFGVNATDVRRAAGLIAEYHPADKKSLEEAVKIVKEAFVRKCAIEYHAATKAGRNEDALKYEEAVKAVIQDRPVSGPRFHPQSRRQPARPPISSP